MAYGSFHEKKVGVRGHFFFISYLIIRVDYGHIVSVN